MSSRNKNMTTVVASVASVGLCLVLFKYRSTLLQRIRLLLNYKDPLRHQSISIINTAEECRKVMANLKRHCAEYNVLGFDCEWVTVGGARRPVALLQLASHRGLCALIRLCNLRWIPPELKEILEDENILKVGVEPAGDASYIARDYGVCVASTFDLRFMAVQSNCQSGGLAKLSAEHLNVKLDKNWHIRCSDWEAQNLTKNQLKYAASDAHVAIELFKVFAEKVKPKPVWWTMEKYVKEIIDLHCFKYLDIHYKNFYDSMAYIGNNSPNTTKNGSLFSTKMQTRNIATRKKPLYYNCYLQAPDGELLCTCAKKKAMWYIEKNIGELITENPFTVRLKFEPAGRAVGDTGKYYQTLKANRCVVCGDKEKYIRKNVVPREYRKYFPFVMKDHTSHDVLLLCPTCHQKSNSSDLDIREKLAVQCDAPLSVGPTANKLKNVPRLRKIRSISRALLLQGDKIPEEKQRELRAEFLELCPEVTEVTDDVLSEYIDIEASELNDSYFAHGERVVEYYERTGIGLNELEKMWREHFLRVMKPKFLPDLWSVDHNVERHNIQDKKIPSLDTNAEAQFGSELVSAEQQ